jgi:Fic family protein
MLFQIPELPLFYVDVLERIENVRNRMRFAISDNLNRWTGFLARMSYARIIHSSNTMEGVNATFDDAVAVVDGEPPVDPQDEDWLALAGHRDAMDYVIQLSREPSFKHNEGTLLGLHFMMMKHDLTRNPGRYRPGPIHVTNMPSGRVVYDGPDADLVPSLMGELIDSLNEKNTAHPVIRAAMAHLNLTMIHPFRDGNGRMARALQTFVLARDGILDPKFSSIEEYVGRNATEYYDVLGHVGQGSWHPENDPLPWIQFCLKAHYFQAQTLTRRIQETGSLWGRLEDEIKRLGLPERTINALMDAATGRRVRNPVYRKDAEVSSQVAKRDLKLLTDAKLLTPKGERRGRVYLASERLLAIWNSCRIERQIDDPFSVSSADPSAPRVQLNLLAGKQGP